MLEKKLPLTKAQFNMLFKSDSFALLREAKLTISSEFSQDLDLHSKDILNHIHAFSKESKDQRLFNIYNKLQQYIETEPQVIPPLSEKTSIVTDTSTNTKLEKIKVGDIVDGKRCTGFYRGQPVFS